MWGLIAFNLFAAILCAISAYLNLTLKPPRLVFAWVMIFFVIADLVAAVNFSKLIQ